MNIQKTTGRTTYVYEDQKSVPQGFILYHRGEFLMYSFSVSDINGDTIGTFRWFDYDDWYFS